MAEEATKALMTSYESFERTVKKYFHKVNSELVSHTMKRENVEGQYGRIRTVIGYKRGINIEDEKRELSELGIDVSGINKDSNEIVALIPTKMSILFRLSKNKQIRWIK